MLAQVSSVSLVSILTPAQCDVFHSEKHVNVSDTLCIHFEGLRLVDSHWLFIVGGGRRLRCLRLQTHKDLLPSCLPFLCSANLRYGNSMCKNTHEAKILSETLKIKCLKHFAMKEHDVT